MHLINSVQKIILVVACGAITLPMTAFSHTSPDGHGYGKNTPISKSSTDADTTKMINSNANALKTSKPQAK